MFAFLEQNHKKYLKMLGMAKASCLEVYNMSFSKIEFYMPMQNANSFFLTTHPQPATKSEEEDKKTKWFD